MAIGHIFPYKWKLSETTFTKDKGKVFSCFSCGGGSSFGYKLAGFDVIGCNEIDPKMMTVYIENHNPKYNYLESIQTFKLRKDLPKELYELDILDGSPPCSNFSMAGNREKDWGKEKKFREGQTKQVLDTLFFDFIDLAKELQPKVVVAENVKGLLLGNAVQYVRRIYDEFDKAGYYCQHFLLDASKMGVPQRRERVFFICLRKDLAQQFLVNDGLFDMKPYIEMDFNETLIPISEFIDYVGPKISGRLTLKLWDNRIYGDVTQEESYIRMGNKIGHFSQVYLYKDRPSFTLTSKRDSLIHFDKPVFLSRQEVLSISSFPQDYTTFTDRQVYYICGMSVPPVMVAQIATKIYDQWLSKIS